MARFPGYHMLAGRLLEGTWAKALDLPGAVSVATQIDGLQR